MQINDCREKPQWARKSGNTRAVTWYMTALIFFGGRRGCRLRCRHHGPASPNGSRARKSTIPVSGQLELSLREIAHEDNYGNMIARITSARAQIHGFSRPTSEKHQAERGGRPVSKAACATPVPKNALPPAAPSSWLWSFLSRPAWNGLSGRKGPFFRNLTLKRPVLLMPRQLFFSQCFQTCAYELRVTKANLMISVVVDFLRLSMACNSSVWCVLLLATGANWQRNRRSRRTSCWNSKARSARTALIHVTPTSTRSLNDLISRNRREISVWARTAGQVPHVTGADFRKALWHRRMAARRLMR